MDKVKNIREYKWSRKIDIEPCIGFGIAIGNNQPKKKYKTASWQLAVLFLCWNIQLNLSYNYKTQKPKQ